MMPLRALLLLVTCSNAALTVAGELVFVQALMRHGTRAPNDGVVKVCPNAFSAFSAEEISAEEIVEHFGAPPGHLTDVGVGTCLDAGAMIRQMYMPSFMSETYSAEAEQWRIEAKSNYRHLMSANALAQGIPPLTAAPTVRRPARERAWLHNSTRLFLSLACQPANRTEQQQQQQQQQRKGEGEREGRGQAEGWVASMQNAGGAAAGCAGAFPNQVVPIWSTSAALDMSLMTPPKICAWARNHT